MDTQNQFTYFLLSVLIGFVGGCLYEIFAFFRLLFGCNRGTRKALGLGIDLIFGFAFAILCIFASFWLRFPDFRGYMWLGYALGGILYLKTLHEIVAFFEKVCYNSITKLIKKAKKREKTLSKRGDTNL